MFAANLRQMEIKACKAKIERTGLYFESGNFDTSRVNWFACHGYGQLANNLIRKLDGFVNRGHFVTSVEGMNRFYWQGVTGQVAATWMTKRSRIDEIEDNNNYLSEIYSKNKSVDNNILFGFSQGGTTIWRWIFEKRPDFDVFINYAGWMPEDIPLHLLKEYLDNKTLIFIHGDEDEYITDERVKAFKDVVSKSGLHVIMHKKKGGHKVDRNVLAEVYEKYIALN